MEQRPLEYTVKIYCEGFTEWYCYVMAKIAKIHDDIANIQNLVKRKSQ